MSHKGNVNAASKGIETLHEDVSEPGRAHQEPSEVPEDRALGLRCIVRPVPVFSPAEDACSDKPYNLTLQARWRHAEVPGEIGEIPLPRGVAVDRRQNGLAGFREEGVEWVCPCLTHNV